MSTEKRRYSWRELLWDVALSLLYTGPIIVLIKLGVLKPIENYFRGRS